MPEISAIIAEYNPLHKGHEFQIEETRKLTGCDYLLVIMSGDFVQRGAPAVFDKYTRTKMALLAGADLVLELPSIYALSSAQIFAKGAVSILNSLNSVNYLSFGSESGDIKALNSCAQLLLEDEDKINLKIKEDIKKGLSYPGAREEILKRSSESTSVLNGPNNILGIEYLKAIISTGSSIKPITIKRSDNGFNDSRIDESLSFASAMSIRNSLFEGKENYLRYVPDYCHPLLKERQVRTDDFSDLLYYKLLCEKHLSFDSYLDVNEEISHKIIKYLPSYTGFTPFIETLKSKNLTYARISRALFHILLNIKYDDINYHLPYVRILGFKKSAEALLHTLKNNSSIDLVTKLADANKYEALLKDTYCADIYDRISGQKINEMRRSPIIL